MHFASNVNAATGSTQAKNAYLTTMRPVNFTSSSSSKALLEGPSKVLSDTKLKQNGKSKLANNASNTRESTTQFNPARIYGKKVSFTNSSSTPAMQTAPKIPLSHSTRFFPAK